MKVKMVGTGSMISSSNPACYCVNDKIMVDMPNGIVKVLKKENLFEKIEYLFITHMHGDHIFDLPFLFLDRAKEGTPLTVFIHKRWYRNIKKLVKLAFPREYYNIFYNSNIRFVSNEHVIIDNIEINSFEVSHGNMKPSFGYIFKENDKVLSFSGDSSLCESIKNVLQISDIIITDCTLRVGNNKHIGVDNVKDMLKAFPKVKIIPSHMSINSKKELLKLEKENLIIKEDLEEIET